jgi:two-component system, NtrC family, response regulator AtoC
MSLEPTVLIIGEDSGIRKTLPELGLQSVLTHGFGEAFPKLKALRRPVVVVNLPGQAVEPAMLRQLSRDTGALLILADSDSTVAGLDGTHGNVRVLVRPFDSSELREAIRAAVETGRANGATGPSSARAPFGPRYVTEYAPLLMQGAKMRVIKEIVEQVANTDATVLIRGESGVGKDLVARAIHHASQRSEQPYVKINCAALPAELLESELFGHEKGAFTGAYRKKLGKFEFAHKGTLFLDEIGDLPLSLQAKLLHVLQDHEFSRVGGRETIRVDARVLASTNRDLEAAMSDGRFREDLFYRLNVVEIHVPPLRERREEIRFLVDYCLENFQTQYHRQVLLTPEAVTRLVEYDWPGNIRELENVIRRLVVLGSTPSAQDEILGHLGAAQPVKPTLPSDTTPAGSGPREAPILTLREVARRAAREAERKALADVLERVHWNRAAAARLLKVSYKTMLSKITECGLDPKSRPPGP